MGEQGKELNLGWGIRVVGFSGDGSEVWLHDADPASPLWVMTARRFFASARRLMRLCRDLCSRPPRPMTGVSGAGTQGFHTASDEQRIDIWNLLPCDGRLQDFF